MADPVIAFYEDGEWLRIELPGRSPRFLDKKKAIEILKLIGANSVSEKSELIIV